MSDSPTPTPREPAVNIPGVVVACCVVLVGIHAIREAVSIETDNSIIAQWALVPARFSLALGVAPDHVTAAYHAAVDRDPVAAAQIEFLIGDGHGRWWTALTYAFLHATWAHVGFNCIWLVAFGSAVARRFSALRFLGLLGVAALAGALAQYLWNIASFDVVIGASAAVAGAMGAATRFIFRPTDEPTAIFDRSRLNEAFRQPALSLAQTVTTRSALLFVVFWFVTNLLFGLVPSLGGIGDAPVAWQAHIGGFVAGLLLFPLFDPARPVDPLASGREDSADLPLASDEGLSAPGAPGPASGLAERRAED